MQLKEQFDEGWWLKLSPFLTSEAFERIGKMLTLQSRIASITPRFNDTFRAFKECPYKDLKVVILGLDPYPTEGVADGIAFSARNHPLNPPKSLEFIINSLERDVYGGFAIGHNEEFYNPDLTRWANQGVLMLNCALSTIVGKTGAHLELWSPFIKEVFRVLRENNTGLVYILLGAQAKMWITDINTKTNTVLTASHPNSCTYQNVKEWNCNRVFSLTNKILEEANGADAKILW